MKQRGYINVPGRWQFEKNRDHTAIHAVHPGRETLRELCIDLARKTPAWVGLLLANRQGEIFDFLALNDYYPDSANRYCIRPGMWQVQEAKICNVPEMLVLSVPYGTFDASYAVVGINICETKDGDDMLLTIPLVKPLILDRHIVKVSIPGAHLMIWWDPNRVVRMTYTKEGSKIAQRALTDYGYVYGEMKGLDF